MAVLSRHFVSLRGRRSQISTLLITVVLVSFVCAIHRVGVAAPITFQFEAVVGPPRDGMSPIDLPFSFALGDRIRGSFRFEPIDAPALTAETLTIQNSSFRLKVKSFELETLKYELRATNDSISDENTTPEDRIDFRCAFGGEMAYIPQSISGRDTIEWAFFAAFGGSGNVLDGADIPADPATWNQLLPGSLLVTFTDTAMHKSNGFVAEIVTVKSLPEPSGEASLVMLCMIGATTVRFIRRRSSIALP